MEGGLIKYNLSEIDADLIGKELNYEQLEWLLMNPQDFNVKRFENVKKNVRNGAKYKLVLSKTQIPYIYLKKIPEKRKCTQKEFKQLKSRSKQLEYARACKSRVKPIKYFDSGAYEKNLIPKTKQNKNEDCRIFKNPKTGKNVYWMNGKFIKEADYNLMCKKKGAKTRSKKNDRKELLINLVDEILTNEEEAISELGNIVEQVIEMEPQTQQELTQITDLILQENQENVRNLNEILNTTGIDTAETVETIINELPQIETEGKKIILLQPWSDIGEFNIESIKEILKNQNQFSTVSGLPCSNKIKRDKVRLKIGDEVVNIDRFLEECFD